MKFKLTIFIPVILFLFCLVPEFALAHNLVGYVRNQAGHPIPNALVELSNGMVFSGTSNDGSYRFTVSAGTYDITASASGFSPSTATGVVVVKGVTITQDFNLAVSPLQLEIVYPSLALLGEDHAATLYGKGFVDGSTRVVMAPDNGNTSKIIGSLNMEVPEAGFLSVVGGTAYVAVGEDGWKIIDVSDPSSPAILSTISQDSFAAGVTVVGNYAFLADSLAGFKVVDVSDPAHPGTPVSILPDDCSGCIPFIASISIVNDTAYLADYNGALWIYDVSTPTAPVYKGMVEENITMALRTTVIGTTAYVADAEGGLRLVNVSNPTSPTVINTIPALDEVTDVFVKNNIAYLADGTVGLRIFNVFEPLSLTELSTYDSLGSNQSVTVVDSIAYVADREKGMQAIDVSDPENPKLIGYVLTEGLALDIEVIGSSAYVTDENGYFQVVDIRGLDFSTIISTNNMSTMANGIDIYKPFLGEPIAFVVGDDGLYSFDVSDPANPEFLDSLATPGNAQDVCIISQSTQFGTVVKAYVADGTGGLRIINVTSPGSMSEISSYATASSALGIDCMKSKDGNTMLAFVAVGSSGLEVVDVSSTPSQFGIIDPSGSTGSANSVDYLNNVAYVADDTDGLRAIDVTLSPPGLSHDFTVVTPGRALDVMVVGSYAYVADRKSGLQIIDLGLATPDIVSSVKTRYLSSGVYVSNNIAYATDYKAGLYAIDVSDPENPFVLGTAYTHGTAEKVEVIDDIAYVADGAMGLTVFPVVREISPDPGASSTEMDLTIPDPLVAGNYHLKVFDSTVYDSLIGAVTFIDDTEIDLLSSKAIIVAGGGPDAGNLVWQNTKAYANQAYDNLIFQGYKHEDIYYLTDEPTPLARYGSLTSVANVAAATKVNLQTAIETWALAEGANDLLIFMEDHGETGKFLMRGGASPQYVTADDLDSWLDTIQCTGPSCLPGKVILVYDACRSGSFISRLAPPSGKTRITITSSEPGQASYFLADDHSFSSHFWSTFSGKTGNKAILSDALERGAGEMVSYQNAQLDADGDGVPNQSSDYTALEGHEGTIYALRRQYFRSDRSKPVIGSVSDTVVLNGGVEAATLNAWDVYDIDGDSIDKVWVEYIAPDSSLDISSATVTGMPGMELTGADGSYEITDYSVFTKHGTYIINYYARDASGVYSLPKTSLVEQRVGDPINVPDQYEDDDTFAAAQVIVVNSPSPQNHSFHDNGDADWVMFYGIKDSNYKYNITASNPTIISDPVIEIFSSSNLGTPILSSNKKGAGQDESIIGWLCPADGLYYVRVRNNSGHYGANVRYKLKVYNPIAFSLPGYVKGRITSGGKGVAGAVIRAGNGTAVTLPDGSFILCLAPDSYSVSVSCSGYQSTSFSISVGSGQSVSVPTKDVNSFPRILNYPPTVIKANELYSYTPSVSEPDGDPLTFSITGKPGWANFSSANGRLWGRPSNANQGTHGPITITVKDNVGAKGSVTFTIKVTEGTGGALPGVFLLLQE